MKILFTADIHIKLGAKNVPVEWAKLRYYELINDLATLQKQCDLLVIGGDIFDKLPNMEELEIYYELVARCEIPTLIYSGNHESIKKNTTFFTYLKSVTKRINKLVTVIDEYYTHFEYSNEGPGTPIFNIIPYNKLKEYEKTPVDFHAPLLFTHVRGAIEPHVKPEVDLTIFDPWQTVLAGDLHSYENSQRNILYPGSPVTTSFHRNVVDTGVIVFDTDTHEHVWQKLVLPQLIRKTVKAGDDMPATDYHHTIYEVEGDLAELGAMADSDLIDKKLLKRETDTALILDPKMTMAEELKEYLLYILQLSEDKADEVVQVFNNNKEKLDDNL
jgi:DNA repair exonuclease SbcCD nuclease subunit